MDTKSETKYERLRKIGIGSYGVVFKCVNRQTGQIVAIKRYSENDSDPIIRKIAMREVRMLRQLRHPNLIHLIEVFRRRRILHLVFDYCELTVLDVIEKYTNNCPLNLARKIIWQLVNGVSHCHSHNCIHRDIKPENILINQSGVVKLCDFGFARNITSSGSGGSSSSSRTVASAKRQAQYEREAKLLGVVVHPPNNGNPLSGGQATIDYHQHHQEQQQQQQQQQPQSLHHHLQQQSPQQNKENNNLLSDRQALTEYVATRWYRAPELLVGDIYYDIKIDIWAIGCVTAELMRGEPIWPGKTDLDQLRIIMCSLGQMTPGQTHTLLAQGLYDSASTERLLSQTGVPDPLERKLPARVGPAGLNFVLSCLQMEPGKRPYCDELLQHPYIQSAHMSQFVKGASHANKNEIGHVTTYTHHQSANKANLSGEDRFGQPGQTVQLVNRSNSQAILRLANNQQPANKRLVLAPESSPSGGSSTASSSRKTGATNSGSQCERDAQGSYQRPEATSHSLVPVPIRNSLGNEIPIKSPSISVTTPAPSRAHKRKELVPPPPPSPSLLGQPRSTVESELNPEARGSRKSSNSKDGTKTTYGRRSDKLPSSSSNKNQQRNRLAINSTAVTRMISGSSETTVGQHRLSQSQSNLNGVRHGEPGGSVKSLAPTRTITSNDLVRLESAKRDRQRTNLTNYGKPSPRSCRTREQAPK